MYASRFALACLTVYEQVHLYECVCKSSHVSFIALGGHYWGDLRLRWDKVLEGDEAGGDKEKRRRGWTMVVETIPKPAISEAELWAVCVWRCLRHLEQEPQGRTSLQWVSLNVVILCSGAKVSLLCVCVCV